jgi:DNA-binding MltR family transcriptional regulator
MNNFRAQIVEIFKYCKNKLIGIFMKKEETEVEELLKLKETVLETATILAKLKGKEGIAESIIFVNEFRETLSKESDRGATLMAAAYIDDKLAELIKKYLIKDRKKILDSLFNFNGAVGTFSSRANLAYCLGLIPENIYDDINTLRNIRNVFAHESSFLTFESEKIKPLCHTFKSHTLNKDKPAKSKFMRTMMSIISVVEPSMREDIKACSKMENFDLQHHQESMDLIKKHFKEKGFDISNIN